jgi:hypothetical protein
VTPPTHPTLTSNQTHPKFSLLAPRSSTVEDIARHAFSGIFSAYRQDTKFFEAVCYKKGEHLLFFAHTFAALRVFFIQVASLPAESEGRGEVCQAEMM